MSLLGPDAACSPGRVRRRRPEWTGPTAQSLHGGDTLRRCVTVVRESSPTAVAGHFVAWSLSPTEPAASRSGDDLDSACRTTSGGGTGENVVGSDEAARRTTEHL